MQCPNPRPSTTPDSLCLTLALCNDPTPGQGGPHLHGILVAISDPAEYIFGLPGPPDGAARQGHHAQTLFNPLASGHLSICVHSFLGGPATMP